MDIATGMEIELFVLGGRGCPELLAHVMAHSRHVPYQGKGDGFYIPLLNPQRESVWIKCAGDGPKCEPYCFEVATDTMQGPSSAVFLYEEILRQYLPELQQQLPGLRLLAGADSRLRRIALQSNLHLRRRYSDYYEALAPFLISLQTGLLPAGGFSPRGYVPCPRLATHCSRFLGADDTLNPHSPLAVARLGGHARPLEP